MTIDVNVDIDDMLSQMSSNEERDVLQWVEDNFRREVIEDLEDDFIREFFELNSISLEDENKIELLKEIFKKMSLNEIREAVKDYNIW